MKRNKTIPTFFLLAFGFLALVLNVHQAAAQHVRNTDYSPDGTLKSNARINPSTLAMELSIPLGGYAGRAGNGLPINLSYSSKVWEMESLPIQWQSPLGFTMNDVVAKYAKRSAGGWSSSLATPRIDYKYDDYQKGTQEVGTYDGQIYDPAPWENPPDNDLFYIKRLQVQMPDGSSHEFRASDAPFDCGSINSGCGSTDFTGTFLSVDGSRMRLDMGTSTSTLFMPDGSRYIFGSNPGGTAGNPAHTFYDRHGNKMAFNTSTRVWTDTLGRVIADPLVFNWDGTQNQTAGADTKAYPGFGTGTYNLIFDWHPLSDPNGEDALENPSDTLRYKASKSCNGNTHTDISPYLFGSGDTYTRICNSGTQFNPVVLTKITLPNGQFYQFKYNIFGEITTIIYPSGAYERFAYAQIAAVTIGNASYDQANRGVSDRYLSVTGNSVDETHWSYSVSRGTLVSPLPYTVTTTAPDGSITQQILFDERDPNAWRPYGFGNAMTGRAYEDRVYDNSSNHYIISRKLTEYAQTGALGGATTGATRDTRPSKEVSIIFESGSSNALATMTETVYDTTDLEGSTDPAYFASLNPKQVKTHNYAVISASTASTASVNEAMAWFSTSTTSSLIEIAYVYDPNYKARNISGLVSETKTLNPSNSDELSKSQILYDQTAYPIIDQGTSVGWEDPATNYRGNGTTTRTWVKETNSWLESHLQFDNFGNVRKTWDVSGDASKYVETQYNSTYGYAYPVKVITPSPATSSSDPHGTNLSSTAEKSYDFNTGLTTGVIDEFGQVTTTEYDSMQRPIRIKPAVVGGTATGPISETIYDDLNHRVTLRKQLDGSNWDETTSYSDGKGRTVKTIAKDSQGDVIVETHYDSMDRADRVTNPYRSGETVYWSKTRYDNAGRAVETYAPETFNNLVNALSLGVTSFGFSTVTGYTGTVVTTIDSAGRKGRSITNAVGQLVRVDEPTAIGASADADLGTISSPIQPTYYTYNLYGKMVKVQQGSQYRYFKYDSLGRLLRVRQPEQEVNTSLNLADSYNTSGQWTAAFTYDNLGNVISTTDAKGVTITNSYDRNNRVKTRSYSGESGLTTPTVNFHYDGKGLDSLQNPNYAKGKLTKVENIYSQTRYTLFDNFGRLTETEQRTPVDTETIATATPRVSKYTYNLSGALVEEEYPSGRKVKNEFEADGDLMSVASRKFGATVFTPYVSNFSYNASGGITQMKLGNGKWETAKFNTRQQVTELGLGASSADAGLWKVNFEYGELQSNGTVDAVKNTGTIAKQTLTFAGLTNPFVQAYKYDSLNRILEAKETTNGNQNWIQNWTYDKYGNRLTFTQNIGGISYNSTPTVVTDTNRFVSGPDFNYDKNGNIIADKDPITSQNRTFIFNGENKQIEVRDVNSNVVGKYFYDGEGKRVKKVVGADSTVFVYSSGKLVAEYSTEALPSSPAVNYTTTDHLGSPRIITDQFGQVRSRRDFMPFGEEIYSGLGGRTGDTGQKYLATTDKVRQKFTGYQKDAETSLDFAEARMYENRFGRFTTVDPLLASGNSSNPQTFNRFIYVGNNPISITDPSGLLWYSQQRGGKTYYDWFNSDPGQDWTPVNFVGNNYFRIDDASLGTTAIGTVYLNQLGNSYLTQSAFDESMRIRAMFEPGGSCFSNYQCAGIRDPMNDANNHVAFGGFAAGFPMGVRNSAKGAIDLPSMNIITFTPGTSLNAMLGVAPWFDYETPTGPFQPVGAAAGSISFNIAATWATGRVVGGFGKFMSRGETFGERLFLSDSFGKESRFFGNSAFDSTGAGRGGSVNRPGSSVKAGWSSTGSNGGGMQFRVGLGVHAQRANVASRHLYIPRTFVPNAISNPFVYRP
ncbi:MAG: RHS repeat-associated core domain-containing protein [Pyrinomonadaceae bacterium]